MLVFDSVQKDFGELQVLKKTRFELEPNQVLAFLGPNGAGKTTAMYAAMDFIPVDGGEVRFLGEPTAKRRQYIMRDIGFVPDEPVFPAGWTGNDLLKTHARLHENVDSAWVASVADRLGVADLLDRDNVKLSKGQRKRVALLLAIAHQPKLLILDELTNGLDPQITHTLLEFLRNYASNGRSVWFSSHVMSHVDAVATRAVVLDNGTVREIGLNELDAWARGAL